MADKLSPDVRLNFGAVATRKVGEDLLIARPDPLRDVLQISGSGLRCWELLHSELTVGQVAQALALETGASARDVNVELADFAIKLIAEGLATPE